MNIVIIIITARQIKSLLHESGKHLYMPKMPDVIVWGLLR